MAPSIFWQLEIECEHCNHTGVYITKTIRGTLCEQCSESTRTTKVISKLKTRHGALVPAQPTPNVANPCPRCNTVALYADKDNDIACPHCHYITELHRWNRQATIGKRIVRIREMACNGWHYDSIIDEIDQLAQALGVESELPPYEAHT